MKLYEMLEQLLSLADARNEADRLRQEAETKGNDCQSAIDALRAQAQQLLRGHDLACGTRMIVHLRGAPYLLTMADPGRTKIGLDLLASLTPEQLHLSTPPEVDEIGF